MNRILRNTLFAFFLLTPVVVNAQTKGENDPEVYNDYKTQGGVATGKSVSGPDSDNNYTITLETFATGESSSTTKRIPSDIILVLDVSGSMDEDMPASYTALPSQSYSYNSYGYNEYYFLYNGTYYEVERTTGGNWSTTYYRLRFRVGGSDWNPTYRYLAGSGSQQNAPNNATDGDDIIFTGVLYTREEGQSKMEALHDAVSEFIDTIVEDDSELDLAEGEVGNQISIVKFAGSERYNITYYPNAGSENSIEEGNHNNQPTSETNYVEVVKKFYPVSSSAGALKSAVNSLVAGGATRADLGLIKAKYLFADLLKNDSDRKSTKVVVFFTDGEPTASNNYSTTVANAAVKAAYDLKHDYNAVVYSVGVFGSNVDSRVDSYMSYVSSDYPNAQSVGTGGEAGGYYQKAGPDMSLSEIFKTIGETQGGAEETIPATTQVRDVVSSSFVLPAGTSASNVSVYTVDVKKNGEEFYSPEDSDYAQHKHNLTVVTGQTGEGEANEDYLENEEKVLLVVGNNRVTIEGFNYTKPDTNPDNHVFDGNWVGQRMYLSGGTTVYEYYGRKLVIEFKIEPQGEATGGVGTNTNAAGSGVYVLKNGQYESVNDYEPPHTTLPVTLRITKTGLKYGESATFEVERIRPKGWDDEKTLAENIENIQYDVTGTGKPLPGDGEWEDWTKVILTQKDPSSDGSVIAENRTPVEKTLVALDPYWVYKVVEDNWGWAYEYTGETSMTTSNTEVNPFNFHNTDKEGVVKHAEAVTINHFRVKDGEIEVENYKSGKVKSF